MKGQLQSMETILIAIVLMLIIIFGIYFFARVTDSQIDEQSREFRTDLVRNKALQLSTLTEFSCPLQAKESRICIDKIKLQILSQALNDPTASPYGVLYEDKARLRYVELLGPTLIKVQVIYPDIGDSVVLFNATSSENLLVQQLPITIFNATKLGAQYELGILTVGLE